MLESQTTHSAAFNRSINLNESKRDWRCLVPAVLSERAHSRSELSKKDR